MVFGEAEGKFCWARSNLKSKLGHYRTMKESNCSSEVIAVRWKGPQVINEVKNINSWSSKKSLLRFAFTSTDKKVFI